MERQRKIEIKKDRDRKIELKREIEIKRERGIERERKREGRRRAMVPLDTISKLKSRKSFLVVNVSRRESCHHNCLTVSSQSILQQSEEREFPCTSQSSD